MTKYCLFINVVLVASALFFVSCSDDDDESTNKKRKVLSEQIEIFEDGSTSNTYYTYDKEGRLIKEQIIQNSTKWGQTNSVHEYSYEGNKIVVKSLGEEMPNTIHLNANGLLEDYESFNYKDDMYYHDTYKYDDAKRLQIVNIGTNDEERVTWEGDDIVKVTEMYEGMPRSITTIVPSTTAYVPNGFYILNGLSSMKRAHCIMGLYGRMPKHLPATITIESNEETSSIRVIESFSYTVTDGLPTACIEQREMEMKVASITQKSSSTTRYTFVWKEIE